MMGIITRFILVAASSKEAQSKRNVSHIMCMFCPWYKFYSSLNRREGESLHREPKYYIRGFPLLNLENISKVDHLCMEALTFSSYSTRKALAWMKGKDHSGSFSHEGKLRLGEGPPARWLGDRAM